MSTLAHHIVIKRVGAGLIDGVTVVDAKGVVLASLPITDVETQQSANDLGMTKLSFNGYHVRFDDSEIA